MDTSSLRIALAEPVSPGGTRVLTPQGALATLRAGTMVGRTSSRGLLVVGHGIDVRGEIGNCNTLLVEGRLDAKFDTDLLQIAEGGAVTGQAVAEIAEIAGRFEGHLVVQDELRLGPKARVKGHIRYARLAVRTGGELSGNVAPLRDVKPEPAARTVPRLPEPALG